MRFLLLCLLLMAQLPETGAAPPQFSSVTPDRKPALPGDFGAHQDFRTEWWYVTGWLQTPDGKPLGFQITFFRSATEHDADNPSRFAPRQLIVAHAALSDPAEKKLLHGERSARQGFDLAYARAGDTDLKLKDWRLQRKPDGSYEASVSTRDFTLQVQLQPTQAPLLQGEQGYSRKGPQPEQASYYYSEPQLRIGGALTRQGKTVAVSGTAWLDHEWSSRVLDAEAIGWDWLGANLDDGSALMAFRIRSRAGTTLWSHATLRDTAGSLKQFTAAEIDFTPLRFWQSPRGKARYPVSMRIRTGPWQWQLTPLFDDQEFDARRSTGAIYWEGAVGIGRDGAPAGRGYLEMTGYDKPMKL